MRYLFLLALIWLLPAPEVFDTIVRGGEVHDGSGAPARRADVALRGDRIVRVGDLAGARADRVIDAAGLVVCPGFIDLHTHSDRGILEEATRSNLNYLLQGCTLVVTGNCGSGHVDVADFFRRIEANGAGTNVAHLVPHGAVRERVMGEANRSPTPEEMERMRALVDRGVGDGAVGMSTGLIYVPGAYARTEELIDLARVVGRHGGLYASHIRNEGDGLLEAIREAVTIGRAGECAVHISHLKAAGRANWGRMREAAAAIETARSAGVRVTADQYPYVASSTALAASLLPADLRSGGQEELGKRLDDPTVVRSVDEAIRRRAPENIMIASFRADPSYNGKTLAELASREGRTSTEIAVDILKRGGAGGIFFGMSEEDVRSVMPRPWLATASDGGARRPDATHPHPRSYGTFPRKIGYYALELGILPLEQAIRSCTALPAEILGVKDRGLLEAGRFADVLVFDPKSFRDRATYQNPHQYAAGVRYVWVNGALTIDQGRHTGKLPGRPIRRPAPGRPPAWAPG